MTLRISGISLVARRINSGLERKFTSEGYEFTRIYVESQIWTDRVRSFWAIGSIACQAKKVSRNISESAGSAHAARNYRPYLKSGDSYLFREEERSRGFGSHSINYFSPFPSPPTFSRAWNSSEKSIKPMAEAKRPCICLRFRHQSRVLVATGVRELRLTIYRE